VGPYEVLSRLPGAIVRFLGPVAGAVRTDTRMLTLETEGVWEDVPEPDVLLVPGGFGTRELLKDERMLRWLRHAHEQSLWTAGVSAGIDMTLVLAGRIAGDEVGQAIQLSIEYDPDPPFITGLLEKAPSHIVDLVRSAEAAQST
jgi:putative intracellular protease/amidase